MWKRWHMPKDTTMYIVKSKRLPGGDVTIRCFITQQDAEAYMDRLCTDEATYQSMRRHQAGPIEIVLERYLLDRRLNRVVL